MRNSPTPLKVKSVSKQDNLQMRCAIRGPQKARHESVAIFWRCINCINRFSNLTNHNYTFWWFPCVFLVSLQTLVRVRLFFSLDSSLQTRRTGTQFIRSIVTCDVRHQFAVPILCVNELPFRWIIDHRYTYPRSSKPWDTESSSNCW